MTKEVLEIRVKEARGCVAEGDPCEDHNALASVADERDAALARIAELERAAETSRAEHAAALGLATARIRELEGERDELLDFTRIIASMNLPWWTREARAIVARIEKATKGTT